MKSATSLADLLSQEQLSSMTGLEVMTGILEGRFSAPPIGQTLGFQLHHVELARVVFQGQPEFPSTNPMGTVHGGWYGTVLDSAMACAVMTYIPRGSIYTTLEYKISIIKPVSLGRKIMCEGITDHVGRSTGVARGVLRDQANDQIYATGTTTCLIMKAN
ncbi:MAG: PaaI family thioesterase [Aestuariivita sp.]|nr:PaaI family thioesterase [Aestuariivita sp.]MCY4203692.1 PaaI family thioesterase [Aestuariivita sp.]